MLNNSIVNLLGWQPDALDNMTQAKQGFLKAYQDRMYDGTVVDLPLYNDNSAINFKTWMYNLEIKKDDITYYDILGLCYAKISCPVTIELDNMDPNLRFVTSQRLP